MSEKLSNLNLVKSIFSPDWATLKSVMVSVWFSCLKITNLSAPALPVRLLSPLPPYRMLLNSLPIRVSFPSPL